MIEAEAELGRLQPPHVGKKRNTIIALVDARLAGRPEETVWARDDTCSRKTYHAKWKKDQVFSSVLERVTELARSWKDTRALRALKEASEILALNSPQAARTAVEAMEDTDPNVRLRAAFGVLDRADPQTAAKNQTQAIDSDDDESPRERLARRIARLSARVRDSGDAGGDDGERSA